MPKSGWKSKAEAARKALEDLGFERPEINFITRDAIFERRDASIHEVDRTPVIFEEDFGSGDVPERCYRRQTIDLGGRAATDRNGKFRWRLKDHLCDAPAASVTDDLSFVATARIAKPIVMTHVTVKEGRQLQVEVFSWDIDGNPAPNIRFSWRCWSEFPIIVD